MNISAPDSQDRYKSRHFVAPFFSGTPFTPPPALLGDDILPPSFALLRHSHALLSDPSLHLLVSALKDAPQVEICFGARIVSKNKKYKRYKNYGAFFFFSLSVSLPLLSVSPYFFIFPLFKCVTNMCQNVSVSTWGPTGKIPQIILRGVDRPKFYPAHNWCFIFDLFNDARCL